MSKSGIRFSTYPRTEPPPAFTMQMVDHFRAHESQISTLELSKGLTSDAVLVVLTNGLSAMGFEVEGGKRKDQKIERPVFYGENGRPTLNYQIDAFHPGWKCGLEVEAGRAWMGNAVYRDLVQALVMVGVEYLCVAVPNSYKFLSGGKSCVSKDYESTRDLADAIYGHSRFRLPYKLIVIGY
jgi:hypothetical protein